MGWLIVGFGWRAESTQGPVPMTTLPLVHLAMSWKITKTDAMVSYSKQENDQDWKNIVITLI